MIKTANLTGSISRNAGGLYESVRRLALSLLAEDVDVLVLGALDEFTQADAAGWLPAKVKAFKPSWPESFGFSPEYLRELIAYDPDLTHSHGIWRYTSVATNNYSRATRSPYIISPHGMLDSWALQNSRWKKVIAHTLYEGAHLRGAMCLRALCESEARAMRQIGLKNPIFVIPNGIDAPERRAWSGEAGKAEGGGASVERGAGSREVGKAEVGGQRSEVGGLGTGRKVLLYLGRIHPKKGLENLLKAWAEMRKSATGTPKPEEWVLQIAGWDQGGHERELKVLSHVLGIDASVVFLGPRFGADKARLYRDCDAFVLPSFSEGVPMVVLEAWANGKPVLMTSACNLPDGFSSGAALRIETNPASIARGLQTLFSLNAADRATMGEHGRQLTLTKFSWPFVAQELKRVYEWMLGGGTPPACRFPD